jgi:hypothetical protein
MNWDSVWDELNASFGRVAGLVRVRYPNIGVSVRRGPGFSSSIFDAYESFAHLPLEAQVEEVVLELACAPSASGGFRAPDGSPVFPETPERHTLRFEIGRGTGQTLAGLPALLLPDSPESREYDEAVHMYVAESAKLAEASVPVILDALAESEKPPPIARP